MPPRRPAPKPKLLGGNVSVLLSITGVLFAMWSHFDARQRETSRESGVSEQFREHEAKTDQNYLEAIRRQSDRLTAHEKESEAEHREMRRDVENEWRREIDATCGQCRERRK